MSFSLVEETVVTTSIQLAVLPFVNLSGPADSERVADGLTELVIMRLASLPPLRVVSRTSSMHYKHTRQRLTDIGRELDVSHIVQGSVLQWSQTMQVAVQLIDAATDAHVFSRIYERDFAETLHCQTEIAQSIAADVGALFGATEGDQ
jgi:TolB-like protein